MTSLVSPSDLADATTLENASIGGRIVACEGRKVWLADAETSVAVTMDSPNHLQPGDLVEMKIRRETDGIWVGSTVAWHQRPSAPHWGELTRLADSRRAQILRTRSRIYGVIRQYFEQQRFVEVETPTFVPSPGLDPYVHSLGAIRRGERLDHLITSPEFHMKRLVVGGMPRIFQFARCFRAEEHGSHHEPEFTLLEWYRAFADISSVMKDTEEIVRLAFGASGPIPPEILSPFDAITVEFAFAEFAGTKDVSHLAREDQSKYFSLWVDHIEPALAQLKRPVFVTRFPVAMAALAQPCHDDPEFAERFELYFGGIELCNGYGELTDPVEQRARFEREIERRRLNREPLYPIDERFMSALEEGLPRAAGNALGVDRLVALATRTSTIAATLAFSDSER